MQQINLRSLRIWTALQIGFGLASLTQAQSFNWVERSLSPTPSARNSAAITYDASTGLTLLFGGNSSTGVLDDTWVFDQNGWTRVFPPVSPPARWGAGIAYDPSTHTAVLFGGDSSNGTVLSDTWTWDGTTWAQRFPIVSPRARVYTAMAYQPKTESVLLFGGEGSNNGGGGNGGDIFGDTWTWHEANGTWVEETPPSSPSARRTNLVYDTAVKAIVLYGGDTDAGNCCDTYYNDTWIWTGVTWTEVFPGTIPPARSLPIVDYDAAIGQLVMFGGYVSGTGRSDTWIWNGSTWAQRQTFSTPPGRWAASAAYDPLLKSIVLFGGELTTGLNAGDTWLGLR